jgi:hypothetical protein
VPSNIINGKIQHDWTFAAAAATAINFKKIYLNLILQPCQIKAGLQGYQKLGVGLA